MVKRNKLSVGGKFIANLIGLAINVLLLKWALDSFLSHANWGQSFWASFFLTGIETELAGIKELVSK
jgi:hypothetical protein